MSKNERIDGNIPLSIAAESDITRSFFVIKLVGVIMIGFVACFFMAQASMLAKVIAIVLATAVVLAAIYYNRRDVVKTKEKNIADYAISLQIRGVRVALSQATAQQIEEAGVLENSIGDDWKPFRIEYFPTSQLIGEIRGLISMCFYPGNVDAKLEGQATPDLFDSSTMVFLGNGNGETLRLLVPSRKVTVQALNQLFKGKLEAGFSRKHEPFSHAWQEAHLFAKTVGQITQQEQNELLDNIGLACSQSFDQRPKVKVWGTNIQVGVAFATAIEVNGRRGVFMPTGYLKKVDESIQYLIEIPAGMPVEA